MSAPRETMRTETRAKLASYIVTVFRAVFHLDDNAPAERYARHAAETIIARERTVAELREFLDEAGDLLDNACRVGPDRQEWNTRRIDFISKRAALLARLDGSKS